MVEDVAASLLLPSAIQRLAGTTARTVAVGTAVVAAILWSWRVVEMAPLVHGMVGQEVLLALAAIHLHRMLVAHGGRVGGAALLRGPPDVVQQGLAIDIHPRAGVGIVGLVQGLVHLGVEVLHVLRAGVLGPVPTQPPTRLPGLRVLAAIGLAPLVHHALRLEVRLGLANAHGLQMRVTDRGRVGAAALPGLLRHPVRQRRAPGHSRAAACGRGVFQDLVIIPEFLEHIHASSAFRNLRGCQKI
mmetsp:Transcript_3574/g.8469  ORF Transcript_3574/g.8469 Transcript_3574/m.8469 type:complete len:244 (-) Transcript_3574:534-1265(-)